jgi:acyl-homoserine lactone synthase
MKFLMVTAQNEHIYRIEQDEFYRARHKVYAEELGWVPISHDGLEIDTFDTAAADYLLVYHGDAFVAGSRLIPTDRPHLLSEAFPDSCNVEPMPRDPTVAEWTRGFVVAERRDRSSLRIVAAACAAVMEHCLAKGYRQVGGIQDVKWIPLWKKMGWAIHLHGDAIDINGRPWQPIYFDVTEAAMMNARAVGRVEGPLLEGGISSLPVAA